MCTQLTGRKDGRLDWVPAAVRRTKTAALARLGLVDRRGFEAGPADGPARVPQAGEFARTGVATRSPPRRGAHEPASYRRGFGPPDAPRGNSRRSRRGGGQKDS